MKLTNLCSMLSEINLKDWEQLIIDTEEVYVILNALTIDEFQINICRFAWSLV